MYLGVENTLYYYLLITLQVLCFLYLYSGSVAKKLFVYFATWQIATFVSTLCGDIAGLLSLGYNEGLVARYILYFISCLILLQLYIFSARDFVRKYLAMLARNNHIFALYPVLAFVVFSVLFSPIEAGAAVDKVIYMLLFEAMIIFTYYLLFRQIEAIYNRTLIESRLASTEQMVLLQKRYYAQLESNTIQQRSMMHDTRHHLVTIASLGKNGEFAELLRYAYELIEKCDATVSRCFCQNSAANAILSGYIERAEQRNISVSVDMELPENIGINRYDLCTVLGNCIENAIEACQRISPHSPLYPKRYIDIRGRRDGDRLILRIKNACDTAGSGHLSLVSSKGAVGGIGLQNVLSVVERHRGSMSTEFGDNCFTFCAVMCDSEDGEEPGEIPAS
ncbi:sensor histidine kinase [Desulfosporosinus acididurans]|nr:sensor histidine kinase [Desulfosporosinus acididurans]